MHAGFFFLQLIFIHPIFLLVCGLYPPFDKWLRKAVLEVKVLPKDGELPLGAYLVHRVPLVVTLIRIAVNMALAYQLSLTAPTPLMSWQTFLNDPWWAKLFW